MMVDFDELKRKAVETTGIIADKSLVFAKRASDKAKYLAKITKLTTEVAAERENLRKNYAEIGKLYCQLHMDDPEPDLFQAVMEVRVSLDKIESKKAEIEALKEAEKQCDVEDDSIEVEFEYTDACCEDGKCDEGCCEETEPCDCGCCEEEPKAEEPQQEETAE